MMGILKFRFVMGFAAISIGSAPALAEDERPCEELAIEMLAGDWEVDNMLIAGGVPYRISTTTHAEITAPGQIKDALSEDQSRIVTYWEAGGTVEVVDENGEAVVPPAEIKIPVCVKIPDTETYYWIQEGWTGPNDYLEYRKEIFASPSHAIEVMTVRLAEAGEEDAFSPASSTHMTRLSESK